MTSYPAKTVLKAILGLIFLTSYVSCESQKHVDRKHVKSLSSLKGGSFRNEYFKLTLNFPAEWTLLNDLETERRNKLGKRIVAEKVDTSGVEYRSSKKAEFLLNINKYRQDAPEAIDGNGGFQVTFVSKQAFPGMSLGSYFESSRDLILKTGLYTDVEEIHDVNVGGKAFKKFGCVLNYQGFQVPQTFYLADIKGCFLAFTYSYRGEQIRKELESIVASVGFY